MKTERYEKGLKVTVLSRYNGSGRFGPDGFEGEWFVVRELPNRYGIGDLLLAREPSDDWEVCVNLSRIEGAQESSWR